MSAIGSTTGLLCALLAVALANTAGGREFSAREAALRALEHGPQGQVIRLDSLSAVLGHKLARSPFLPRLDLGAGWNATRTLQSGGNDDFNNHTGHAGLTLGWTLFRGMGGLADSRRATAEALRGQAQALQDAENLALSTLEAWHALRLAERRLVIAEENARISRDRYQQDSLRRDLGAVGPQVLLNGELALQADESARLAREQELRAATVRLHVILGLEDTETCTTGDSLAVAFPVGDGAELPRQAREHGPAAVIARLDETIAGHRETAALSGRMPRLDLVGSVSQRDSRTEWMAGTETYLGSRSTSAGINLSWDLYSGGQNQVSRQRARIATRQAGLRLEETLARAEAEARLALQAWQTLDHQRLLARDGVEVARRQLELVSQQYALGSASSLDFRDAQLSLAFARQNLATLDADWTLARLEIERQRGRLLETVLGVE